MIREELFQSSENRNKVAFIAEYVACLMGSNVHTSRVIRNSKRIGESLDMAVHMTALPKSLILTLHDKQTDKFYTEVIDIPELPINFEYNSELSSLSWKAYDQRLPLDVLWEEYRQIKAKPKMAPKWILLMVGLANASFCKLFGGDWSAVGIVFLSTLAGFFVRQMMHRRHVNHFITFTVSAFVASACASVSLLFDTTSEIAVATSVLFLIPGVPLINGVLDIVEGHTLTGASRLMHAVLLIICVATGLSLSLLLFKNSLL